METGLLAPDDGSSQHILQATYFPAVALLRSSLFSSKVTSPTFNKDVMYGIKLGAVLGFSDVFVYKLVHENWKFMFKLLIKVTGS